MRVLNSRDAAFASRSKQVKVEVLSAPPCTSIPSCKAGLAGQQPSGLFSDAPHVPGQGNLADNFSLIPFSSQGGRAALF